MNSLLFNVIVLIIVTDIMTSINGVEFPIGDVNLALEPTTIPPDHHGLETTTSTNTESGSTFSVSDVAFNLPQLPPGFVETASIIHCACLAHSLDATTDGFVYSADGGKCWTSVTESPNPEVGDVTVKVGRRVEAAPEEPPPDEPPPEMPPPVGIQVEEQPMMEEEINFQFS